MTTRPWYTPAGALARLSALAVSADDPNVRALGVFLYGAFDLLGVTDTFKLVLNLRRKHGKQNKKHKVSQLHGKM